MILDRVLKLYTTEPDLLKRRAPGKGNPTASSVGNCLAQLEMLRVPLLTSPELRSARSAMVFEDGDLHAADLRAKIGRAFPKLTGLQEELFYVRIPVTPAQADQFLAKLADRSLWGTLIPEFLPPRIRMGHNGGADRMRLAPRDERPGREHSPRPLGFVLDLGNRVLWAPLYVDHVIRHPEHGLVVAEYKSMSRFAFRHALLAELELRNRMQLAMIAEATGLPTVWFIKAKDTAHLLEIAFLPTQTMTTVTITRTNGQQDRYVIPKPGLAVEVETGKPVELREAETWDAGQMFTPYDTSLIEAARARVLKVLLFQVPTEAEARALAWDREYGPTFVCPVCQGTGTQTLRKDGTGMLKNPKPCEDCVMGYVERAELPNFPCGYCPVVKTCWAPANVVLEVTDKPRYFVLRADMITSRITWVEPESQVTTRPVDTEVDTPLESETP